MTESEKLPVLAVVGPTASGKTALGVMLAKQYHGEVISADSMQIYQGLDIATAKPTPEEQDGVPHHLIGCIPIDAAFSVADYLSLAKPLIQEIHDRNHLPIVVGGTGLYVSSLLSNVQLAPTKQDPALRQQFLQYAAEHGNDALHDKLKALDPQAAAEIHPNNLVRVVRALEVCTLTGKTFTACKAESHQIPSPYRSLVIGLTYERSVLYDRINERVDQMVAQGLVDEAYAGDIIGVFDPGIFSIGDTICSPDNPVPIEFQKISEPTIAMQFVVNDSPFAGQEGKFVTSRHLRDRLFRELNTDVSLRVEETDNTDSFKVSGRGELHLSVLVENMRREGYEFAVSKAEVLYKKDENGKQLEPMETVYIDVPDEFTGTVIDKLSQRKGELRNMGMSNGGYTRLEFSIPSRGLIGYRGEFLTDTKGNGIMNTAFDCYAPYKGDIQYRSQGSLIAFETGEAVAYGLFNAQDRGTLFIGPGEKVYSGMVIGQNAKTDDIELNVCKTKHLTNTRSSSADEALKLTPPRILSLEEALDFIDTDELLEVTPKSLRIRKKILDPKLRKRSNFQ